MWVPQLSTVHDSTCQDRAYEPAPEVWSTQEGQGVEVKKKAYHLAGDKEMRLDVLEYWHEVHDKVLAYHGDPARAVRVADKRAYQGIK
jgi:hypothetical protein